MKNIAALLRPDAKTVKVRFGAQHGIRWVKLDAQRANMRRSFTETFLAGLTDESRAHVAALVAPAPPVGEAS
jgi:hypothetical protein